VVPALVNSANRIADHRGKLGCDKNCLDNSVDLDSDFGLVDVLFITLASAIDTQWHLGK
jgi:hypothetical protein